MKTIRELADETGKSKTAIMKKIDNLGLRQHLSKVGDRFAVDEKLEALIKTALQKIEPPTANRQPVGDKSPTLQLVGGMIFTLQEQLKAKDALINDQQQTIRELTAALENTTSSLHAAQALHAGTMQKRINGDVDPADPEVRRQGFISRIFGKRFS